MKLGLGLSLTTSPSFIQGLVAQNLQSRITYETWNVSIAEMF